MTSSKITLGSHMGKHPLKTASRGETRISPPSQTPLLETLYVNKTNPKKPHLPPHHQKHILQTNQTAQFVPHSNHDWLNDSSIIKLRGFTARYITFTTRNITVAKAYRKFAAVPTCTHYIETADLAVNLNGGIKLPNEVIAFAAYAHDLIEDFAQDSPEMEASFIVNRCWKGDQKWKPLLIDTLEKITDPPALYGAARHEEQIRVANNEDPSGLVAHIRFCDKLSTLNRDYTTLLDGVMPFGTEDRFRRYFEERLEVVDALNINPRLKRWYYRLISKVETAIETKPKGLRNDFLDPVNYVLRSTSDYKKIKPKLRSALTVLAPSL
ncbi:MAG: hypothetical protein WC612_00630 [Bdellovibrionales bacterium]|jgi:hypothetical protein